MPGKWIPSQYRGVRYREDDTRKHGVKADRYFSIRYKVDGEGKEEATGWASEGMTAAKSNELRAMLMQNIRSGVHPQSLQEMRDMSEHAREEEALAAKLEAHKRTTFAEFWELDYLPTSAVTKKPRTIAEEKGVYSREVERSLGSLPLRDITPAMVERIVAGAVASGKAAQTVRHIVEVIRQVWNLAVDRGIVSGDSPTRRVKLPRKDNRRMRFLTAEEVRRLLDVLKVRSVDTHDAVVLSVFAGLRFGEIHALTWADVNLDAGTVLIRDPKNKKNRHAHIVPEIEEVLLRRGAGGMNKREFVIPSRDGERRQWVSGTFSQVVDELGFNDGVTDDRDKVVFHSCRHTFGSWLVQRGVPLYTVAELMGHSSLEMTKRYSHLAPDTLRAAASSLSGALDRKTGKVIPFRKASGEDVR